MKTIRIALVLILLLSTVFAQRAWFRPKVVECVPMCKEYVHLEQPVWYTNMFIVWKSIKWESLYIGLEDVWSEEYVVLIENAYCDEFADVDDFSVMSIYPVGNAWIYRCQYSVKSNRYVGFGVIHDEAIFIDWL